jgi:uncharacterized alpha-E superfamily protein
MLGRTAASLFWMSRYMERAENVARLTEVGYRSALTPDSGGGHRGDWQSVLSAAGCQDGFEARGFPLTADAAREYLLFDRDNPSSVMSCIENARNNARSVRTAVTREMWEALNSTWNEFAALVPAAIGPARVPEILDWIRQRTSLFRGALVGTLLRDEGYHFSQIGAYLERADNTARILKMKYSVLLPTSSGEINARSAYQWETILRSVSAHSSYRYFYQESFRPHNIAEFLVLRQEMPRSLRHCTDLISDSLRQLVVLTEGGQGCVTLAEQRFGALSRTQVEQIMTSGLGAFLDGFINGTSELATAIGTEFHFL